MGFIKSRYVSEVTFVDSLSTDDDLRDLTLRIETEGAGKYLKLSNGLQGGDIWFYHPDDLKRLYETAVQLWAQGDAISDSTVIERPQFYDVAGRPSSHCKPGRVLKSRRCGLIPKQSAHSFCLH